METTTPASMEKISEIPAQPVGGASRIPDLARLAARITFSDTPHDLTTIRSPFTGAAIGTVPLCTAEDVLLAFQHARNAQRTWAQTRISQRKAIFLRYHDLVLQHKEQLLDLIQMETGKDRLNAHDEILDVIINSRHYAHRAAKYLRPRRRKGALPFLTHTMELHLPVGVVGIISPWNFPLVLTISDAIPAILAGNCVVLKPAHETPFTVLYAVQLLQEAGLPPDVFQVVTGRGSQLGPAIIKEADFLAFTGGTSTGQLLAAQAGERLMKSSMELGGKNPAIVLDDADLDKAVTGVLRGAFTNAGQVCIHLERVYVQSGIYDRFVPELVRRTQAMKLSAALDFSADMGSLISQDVLDKVTLHLDDALQKGATLLAGGKARPDLGPYFFEPTILADVRPEMILFAEETFGPVVSIYRFEDVEQAVQLANDSSYGLNSCVWTRNVRLGQQIASRLQTGTVNVNESLFAAWVSVDSPMGGMKTSGLGSRHGVGGLLKYTEVQTVATQSLMLIGPNRFLPPERYARIMTALLKMMKSIPGLR